MKNRFWARCLRSVPPSCEWSWCETRTSPFHNSHGLWTRGRLGDGRWLGRQGNWKQTPRILSLLLFFWIKNLTVAYTSSIFDIWAPLLAICQWKLRIHALRNSGLYHYSYKSSNTPSLDHRNCSFNDLRHGKKNAPFKLKWILITMDFVD